MDLETVSQADNPPSRPARQAYRPGDLVTTVAGYPVLYEILSLETDDLVRVRGMNWAAGYSAMVGSREIRPVTSILAR
jgi:hypothetical protein